AGSRIRTWHLMPTERMDPPPGASPPMRMTASWSGSNDPTVYKSVARRCAPMASSPRILKRQTGTVPTLKICKKVPVAGHHRSACSGVKALRNTSLARAASRQALLAFRSLDPFRALRESDRRRRDEERPSRSEQRTGNKPKTPLDRKSPIQVRIRLPPATSLVRIWPRCTRSYDENRQYMRIVGASRVRKTHEK